MLRQPGLARRVAQGLALLALLVACQAPVAPPAAPVAAPAPSPLERGREAMNRGDYAAAFLLLEQALVAAPDHLEARYRLGVCASQLDRFEEATRAFEWVVRHGPPGAPEVIAARQWLAAAQPLSTLSTEGPESPQASPTAPSVEQRAERGRVSGRASNEVKALSRRQVALKGVPGTPTQNEWHVIRTDYEGNFQFANVVPGEYMLTDAIAGEAMWRLRVTVNAGDSLVLNLTPENITKLRNDFPDYR